MTARYTQLLTGVNVGHWCEKSWRDTVSLGMKGEFCAMEKGGEDLNMHGCRGPGVGVMRGDCR